MGKDRHRSRSRSRDRKKKEKKEKKEKDRLKRLRSPDLLKEVLGEKSPERDLEGDTMAVANSRAPSWGQMPLLTPLQTSQRTLLVERIPTGVSGRSWWRGFRPG